MPPNILLVVFDTARADAFEPYGAGVGATPAVAQLASMGSALTAAYSPSNWTLPSHISMLTGLSPRQTGLTQAPGGKPVNCKPYVEAFQDRLLPEVLRRNGYSTRGVSANAWISKGTGFATGFDEFHDVLSERQVTMNLDHLRARARWIAKELRAQADDGADEIESLLGRWIDESPRQPFFWFVNLVECHSPYLPPKPYSDVSLLTRVRAARDVHRYQTVGAVWRACAVREPISSRALSRMRHLYGRSIRQLDDWLGRLLERMDAASLLKDTIVIVTSDHGENLGESNLIGHAFSLDERLVHVPFIASGPLTVGNDGAFSLTSLPAALAASIGLHDVPWENNGAGVAVAQYDALTSRDDPRVEETAALWGLDESAIARLLSRGTAATDGALKLVREHGTDRLYDVKSDRLETNPLDPSRAPEALRAALDRAEQETAIQKPDERLSPGGGSADQEDENAELERRLKLLGYL